MSNKQSMKLYTEEQVRKALDFFLSDEYKKSQVIETLTPIELPSDDEIQDESEKYYDNNAAKAHDYYFKLGAKWMRDKIQGGNNDQQ